MMWKKVILEYEDEELMDKERRYLYVFKVHLVLKVVGEIFAVTWSIHFASSNDHYEGHS